MFTNKITSTPLVNADANEYFNDKISGEAYLGDVSFLSTLRALLLDRAADDSVLFSCFSNKIYSMSDMSFDTIRYYADDICDHHIYLMDYDVDYDDNADQLIKIVKDNFLQTYPGFVEVPQVELFFRKSFRVVCYINAEYKKVALFTVNLDKRRYHYLQCSIPAFLPWYFDPAAGISKLEMDLLESLRETTSDKYLACIAKFAETLDLRTFAIKKKLKGFESSVERRRLNTAQTEVDNIVAQINDLNDRIMRLFEEQEQKNIVVLGLQSKIASMQEDSSELMEYFLSNKKLELVSASGDTIRFICHDYLTYIDEEQLGNYLSNTNSYFYAFGNGVGKHRISDEDIKRFLEAVFIKHMMHIRFCSCYEIRMGSGVSPYSGYSYPTQYTTYMPNPHIDQYRCMGNYVRLINACVQRNDYIGAIENCVSSNKSLNLSDGTVLRTFMKHLVGECGFSPCRCIELPDGSVVNIEGAIAYLNETETEEK